MQRNGCAVDGGACADAVLREAVGVGLHRTVAPRMDASMTSVCDTRERGGT